MNQIKNKNLTLTSRGQYAVMALIELSQKSATQPTPLASIEISNEISLSYLEQLFSGLRKNGIVKSYRGPGGGYVLAKEPSEITIADILLAAEDCTPARRVKDGKEWLEDYSEETNSLWSKIGNVLYLATSTITLADLNDGEIQEHPTFQKLFQTLD